jgi:SAM-dependent methyltransferase
MEARTLGYSSHMSFSLRQKVRGASGLDVSRLLRIHEVVHATICGRFPNENILHAQFLSSVRHRRAIGEDLKQLDGVSVLDVGCGEQPYRALLGPSCKYTGIDVNAHHPQTIVIDPAQPWPVEGPFDFVLCTQVLEHVVDACKFCKEIDRVLAPGGRLLLSVPFIYPIHDSHDYRRLSPAGVAQFFPGCQVEKVRRLGGIGSTIVLLFNTWIDQTLCFTFPRRLLKGLIFPIRLPVHALLNAAALLIDWVDRTGGYFHNSLVTLRKANA